MGADCRPPRWIQQSLFEAMPNELEPLELILRGLPKIDLHAHLTGCARLGTIHELVHEYDVYLPRAARADLTGTLVFQVPTRDLRTSFRPWRQVLNRITGVPQVMDAVITRLILEAAEDFANDGVVYAELRVSPRLPFKHGCLEGFLEAVDGALMAAQSRFETQLRVVLGFTRHDFALLGLRRQAAYVAHVLAAAEPYRGRSVVGFDLWGDEAEYPPRLFVEAFRAVRYAGYPLTIHAGEASSAQSIREAVELLRCRRLGHATAIAEDGSLFELVRRRDILLEACVTSNWVTGVVDHLGGHPLRDMVAAGVAVALCTDNTLVFNTSLSREFAAALRAGLIDAARIPQLLTAAASHSFASTQVQERLVAQIGAACTAEVLDRLQQLAASVEAV